MTDQHETRHLSRGQWVLYPKSKKDDLTDKETAILRDLVKEL